MIDRAGRRYDPARVLVRWRGDGPFPKTRWLHAPNPKKCGVRGCPHRRKSRGLCQMHYSRWQHTGSAGVARAAAHHWHLGRRCKSTGCEAESRDMGWCSMHYANWLALTAGEKRCRIAGCERPGEVEGEICRRHYNRDRRRARRAGQLAKEAADPSLRRSNPCKAPGCEERQFQLGSCAEHYQVWLSETAHLERCSAPRCKRPKRHAACAPSMCAFFGTTSTRAERCAPSRRSSEATQNSPSRMPTSVSANDTCAQAPAPPTPPPLQMQVALSVADELAKLAQLRDSGVLTDGEFAAAKLRLLKG